MRVLWFEVTQPKNYGSHNFHGAGWQDSLEILVKKNPEIVLAIAFESNDINNLKKEIDGCVSIGDLIKKNKGAYLHIRRNNLEYLIQHLKDGRKK